MQKVVPEAPMKTALFYSNEITDLEDIINAWLEEKRVTIEDVVFSPSSPGENEGEKFALLFFSDSLTTCATRVKIFDSGTITPIKLVKEIDAWLQTSNAKEVRTKQFVTPAINLNIRVRIYIFVLYTS